MPTRRAAPTDRSAPSLRARRSPLAQACAPGAAREAFFLDFNSASPGAKSARRGVVDAAGGRYVEGAVMTSCRRTASRCRCCSAGPARGAAPLLDGLGFAARVASEKLGVASATKMCRSVMIKGLEAMVIESFTAARHYGVEDAVLASLKETFPGIDWEQQAAYFFQRVIEHGRRRSEEVREVAVTVREAGLDTMAARAAPPSARRRVADLADAGVFGTPRRAGLRAQQPTGARRPTACWRMRGPTASGRSADTASKAKPARRPRWRSSAAARPACCCRSSCSRSPASTASCSSGRAVRYVAVAHPRRRAREHGTVDLLRANGLSERMAREGQPARRHAQLVWAGRGSRSSSTRSSFLGRRFMTYGQTQIQEDLFAAADRRRPAAVRRGHRRRSCTSLQIERATTSPSHASTASPMHIDCELIAAATASTACRARHPAPAAAHLPRRSYPFGWLGIMARVTAADRPHLRQPPARLRAGARRAIRDAQPLLYPGAARRHTSTTGPTSASGLSSRRASRRDLAVAVVTGRRRSRNRSRRCAAMWPSRCAGAGCAWPVTPRTSCRPPAPKG